MIPKRWVRDAEIVGGALRFEGTRIPVGVVSRLLQDGWGEQAILESYPVLDAEDVRKVVDALRLFTR